jgi:hypothetical protein
VTITKTTAGRVIMLIAVMLAASVHTPFAQQADPRREPATALKEAARLLEAKDYANFIQKCIAPDELEKGLKMFGSVDKIVAEFNRSGRFELALKALQAAMKTEPEFYDDRTRANYRFDAPIDGEMRLQLRKVGGLWYWAD